MAGGDGVDAMYMDNLDEFINDENKVVTYRWLSTTLQVHVNQAKQMLYNFVIDQRNKKDETDLNVTYFVAGLQKNESSTKVHRCEVVSEDKLDAIKSSFQKLYSCHVYSVQKSKLQESNALYITDYNLMKENIFDSCSQSAIKFNAAKRVIESKPVIQEIKREDVKPSFLDNDAKSSKSEIEEKTEKTSAPKKNNATGIAGMFAKANVKKESPKSSEQAQNSSKTETKETGKKNSAAPKKSPGVMSFFANSTAKSKPSEEKPKPLEEKPKEIKKETTVFNNKKKDEKIDIKKNGYKKKPASSDSDEEFVTQKKKRRRIKNDLFDSSSEEEMEAEEPLPSPPPAVEEETKEEEAMEDDEAPIPDTPEQKPKVEKVKKEEPPAVTVNSEGRRRKHIKRKKKKTYLNDEGFMVTETVMESDSTDASDIETSTNKPAEAKKPGPAAVAAKAHADKGKQKQSSLMSFFTKK